MDEIHAQRINDAGAAALFNALATWRKEHAPSTDLADLLADALQAFTLTLSATRTAVTYVTVELKAKHVQDDAVFMYKVTRSGDQSSLTGTGRLDGRRCGLR